MNKENVRKVFQGVKFFWRTRNSLDIILAEHTELDTTEIIIYEPSIDKEATRIYLNTTVLRSKIDQVNIDAQISFAKRNNVPLTEEWIESIVNKAKGDYVMNRLQITEFSSENKVIEVSLQLPTDVNMECDPLLGEKQPDLKPFRTAHQATLM